MKYFVRATIAAVVLLPAFASAQTDTSSALINQAQALLQQIQQLQAQLTAAQGGGAGVTGSASGGVCISGAAIKPGQSGADVRALQQFLAQDPDIYPQGTVSGFYGPLTQAAVQRWQAAHNIVSSGTPSTTGYGSVGPRTAAAMLAACGGSASGAGGPDVGGFIKVSPVDGTAPMQVNADATINSVKSCAPAVYVLTWGDGSAPISINVPANTCDVLEQTYTHTYTVAGKYTLTLSAGPHATTAEVNVSGVGVGTGSFNSNNTGAVGFSPVSNTASQQIPTAAIQISAQGFNPKSLTVKSGTKITWTNTDTLLHTVTADNGSYNSGDLEKGESYSQTFTTKGEYTYYCAFHGSPGGGGMSGKIIVQ